MGNITIDDITQKLAAQMANLASGIEGSNQKVSTVESFSKSLDDATSKIAKVENKDSETLTYSKGTTVDKSSARDVKSEVTEKKDVSSADDKSKVANDIATGANKVKDSIKDKMDVSDEELETAMQSLGMVMQDLLDPKKLQELMMELGGVSDSISLITNEQLYADIKSVVNLAISEVDTIIESNGISMEDFSLVSNDSEIMNDAFANLQNVFDDLQNIPENNNSEVDLFSNLVTESDDSNVNMKEVVETTNEASTGNVEKAVEVTVTGEKKAENVEAQPIKTDVKASDVNEATENGTKDLSDTESFTSVAKSETDPMKGRNEGFENVSKMSKIDRTQTDGISDASSFAENVTVKTEVNNVGDVVETVTTYSSNDAGEIVSQVTESIRVNYTEDTTSLELQLHPASLGTVNMTVSATNGIVTAHIIVQDEAVKAALESQLLTLQETFEEQGHKVEAVEVSIANYDLNQGMNRDNSQNESERQEKGAIRTSGARRRINLAELDGDLDGDETLSEEELIARDMMARNGNTLDYQA